MTMYASNIYAGARSICAKLLNDSVACWGENFNNELTINWTYGNPINYLNSSVLTPTLIEGFGNNYDIAEMALGADHSCILFGMVFMFWG